MRKQKYQVSVYSAGKMVQSISGRSDLLGWSKCIRRGRQVKGGWGSLGVVFSSWPVYHLPTFLTVLVKPPVCGVLHDSSASQVKPHRLLSKSESRALGTGKCSPVRQPCPYAGAQGQLVGAQGHRGSTGLHQMPKVFHHFALTIRLEQPELKTDATGQKELVALGVKLPL